MQSRFLLAEGLDGTSLRQQINAAHIALSTCFFGVADPYDMSGLEVQVEAGMIWINTSPTPHEICIRNEANTEWVIFAYYNVGDETITPGPGTQDLLDEKVDLAGGTLDAGAFLRYDTYTPTDPDDLVTKDYVDNISRPSPIRWMVRGTAAVNSNLAQALIEQDCTAVGLRLYADTAPVGASLTVQITRKRTAVADDTRTLSITTGTNAATVTFPSSLALLDGDRIRLAITSIGSGTPGGNDLLATLVLAP